MTPRGYIFDAYGTLFDVHSVVEVGREVTSDPMALSSLWRQKQRVQPGLAGKIRWKESDTARSNRGRR